MTAHSNEGGFGLQEVTDVALTFPEKTSWEDLLPSALLPPSPPWDSSTGSKRQTLQLSRERFRFYPALLHRGWISLCSTTSLEHGPFPSFPGGN